MMIKEHDCVVLTRNLPEEKLEAGDMGTVVHIHNGGAGYEVEFMTLTGETVAVVTMMASDVRPLSHKDLAHTREWENGISRSPLTAREPGDSPTSGDH